MNHTPGAARFACALSTASSGSEAVSDALRQLEQRLDGVEPDLVLAFATHHYGASLETLGPTVARATGARALAGCTAESVLGDGREIEGSPGLVLWAATLPGTKIEPFHAVARRTDGVVTFSSLPVEAERERGSLLVLADPFTFPVDAFLDHVQEHYPALPMTGGIASGAMGPGQTLFFTADGVEESGLQGLMLSGQESPRAVVSQGCRPVGKPFVITACERNEIQKLAGRPALEVLFETVCQLEPSEQRLFQSGPFVGLAVDATRSTFERGDLLVRGVMGVNHAARSFSVSDFVRRGQTIHLQVRDPERAGEDLQALVQQQGGGALASDSAAGALVFTCNGRGSRLFGCKDHDVRHVQAGLGRDIPTAGFFAAGEIGPVGGRNFLHGFTASVAVFRGA
ncbi:MAG: FIST N-terminal domain-containing protein [Planctomycetota bacterium]